MNLSSLKRARDFEVETWLEKIPDLSDYQKGCIRSDEFVRFAPFYFYKRNKNEKSNVLWRLTIAIVPLYLIVIICGLPINMIFTGEWGYGRAFIDNFHRKWFKKLGL